MKKEEIEKEIETLEEELKGLQDEEKIIDALIEKKGDNNRYKALLIEKKEVEVAIAEVQVQIEILKEKLKL
jgi:hypothetical protein